MKTLYLLRHGKSSHERLDLPDRDRPLLEKGIKRTERLVERLRERGIIPDALWSSDAVRARDTAEIVQKKLTVPNERMFVDERIYDADDLAEFYGLIRDFPDEFDRILIVGHNPLLSELAERWIDLPDGLPTSGFIALRFDAADWSKVVSARCLESFVVFVEKTE